MSTTRYYFNPVASAHANLNFPKTAATWIGWSSVGNVNRSAVRVDGSDNLTFGDFTAGNTTVTSNGELLLQNNSINVLIALGAAITFGSGSTSLHITGTASGIAIDYAPAAPANWVGPAPTTLEQAIDRIAAVVSNGGVTPIP